MEDLDEPQKFQYIPLNIKNNQSYFKKCISETKNINDINNLNDIENQLESFKKVNI